MDGPIVLEIGKTFSGEKFYTTRRISLEKLAYIK